MLEKFIKNHSESVTAKIYGSLERYTENKKVIKARIKKAENRFAIFTVVSAIAFSTVMTFFPNLKSHYVSFGFGSIVACILPFIIYSESIKEQLPKNLKQLKKELKEFLSHKDNIFSFVHELKEMNKSYKNQDLSSFISATEHLIIVKNKEEKSEQYEEYIETLREFFDNYYDESFEITSEAQFQDEYNAFLNKQMQKNIVDNKILPDDDIIPEKEMEIGKTDIKKML